MQHDDRMDVVGHDHERVQFHIGPQDCRAQPLLLHDGAERAEMHVIIRDLPEQAFPAVRTDRQVIRTGPRIVVALQPDGPAAVDLRIVPHRHALRAAPHSKSIGAPFLEAA
jgi:hypothetical protein